MTSTVPRCAIAFPSPAPLKARLAMQGRVQEELRLPMTPVSKTCKAKFALALGQVMAMPVWPVTSGRTVSESAEYFESREP